MPLLTGEQWLELIATAVDNDETIMGVLEETLWPRRAYLDEADVSGDLRYYQVIQDGLDLVLFPAASDVATSDGGGQSGQWDQHFDHLLKLRESNAKLLEAQRKAVSAMTGISMGEMNTYSLTPVLPGYRDPASPGYLGDPRYRGGPWGPRLP